MSNTLTGSRRIVRFRACLVLTVVVFALLPLQPGMSVLPASNCISTTASFAAARSYAVGGGPSSGTWVALGDFNGDHMPDLATANRAANSVSVLLNNGDGSFGTATNSSVGGGDRKSVV